MPSLRALAVLAAASALFLLAGRPARASGSSEAACIATAVYYESQGEPASGMVAVGSVVRNRAASAGASACSVVYERSRAGCQFGWACRSRRAPSGIAWNRSRAVALALVSAPGLPDPSNGAFFFNSCRFPPSGVGRLTARIGGHCFWAGEFSPPSRRGPPPAFSLVQAPASAEGWKVVLGVPEDTEILEVAQAPTQHTRSARRRRRWRG